MKKQTAAALTVGYIFALGLGLSGMTQPRKVIGFLNIFGEWDPSLGFVMAGAVFVHFFTYRWIRRRNSPLLTADWHIPKLTKINGRLVAGSFLFGIGWGLAGYCPGPALTGIASSDIKPVVFVIAMIGGMMLYRMTQKRNPFTP